MNKHLRIINCNLKSILPCSAYIAIACIFILIFTLKINNLYCEPNSFQCINIIFYGPINLTNNVAELFIWSMYQFYLLYIVGNYIFKEFRIRNIYIIGRIGNKIKWNNYMQLTIFFTCIIYYLFGIILDIIGLLILNKSISLADVINILNIYLILVISSYFISTIYYIILLVYKNHSLSFLIMVIITYLSIMFGDALNIDKFLPINHGILSKHYFMNFGFKLSYIYLCILIIVNLFSINKFILKNDIVDYMN